MNHSRARPYGKDDSGVLKYNIHGMPDAVQSNQGIWSTLALIYIPNRYHLHVGPLPPRVPGEIQTYGYNILWGNHFESFWSGSILNLSCKQRLYNTFVLLLTSGSGLQPSPCMSYSPNLWRFEGDCDCPFWRLLMGFRVGLGVRRTSLSRPRRVLVLTATLSFTETLGVTFSLGILNEAGWGT